MMKKVLILLLSGSFLLSCGNSKKVASGDDVDIEKTLDDANAAVLPLVTRIQKLPGVTLRGGVPVFIKNSNTTSGRPPYPLYVVDGLIVGNSFRSVENIVQPVDVADIKALTGSNASVYGTRGANGVIEITTKKGN
ncbi:TonB-dependent receptor plug domain-containing protein [Robiginitalea aurantiaca]|uniref:TonB-dependent receptor plug domain-containing protein n=1 Tax=Robiginitalea aurantiaca TaxID=3056915 RepID=A0ABT7WAY1_9FLAO|nr:TonB-dependent receptor plug domain-containing protein [Robiginitalea aurantiaca]MDM9630081.1 TonB-dependent receptor plug domain-containing protein [Robiginitalea aurantiaca]